MPPIDFTRRTALYRLFDKEGRLLYVGVAFDPAERWKDHAMFKPWWPLAVRKVIEWHPTRTEALLCEATAIRDESPLHNIKGSDIHRSAARQVDGSSSRPRTRVGTQEARVRVSDQDWAIYSQLCRDKGFSSWTADLRLYIKAQVAAFERKQRAKTD